MARKAGLRGALPPRKPHPFHPLRDLLVSDLPAPSGPFEYGAAVSYPMALNDKFGDCTIAGYAHGAQVSNAIVNGSYTYPGDPAVEDAYCQILGCTPQQLESDPKTYDTGLELSQVVEAGSTGTGLLGMKLAGAATIDIADEELLAQALYNFGWLYVAFNLPEVAETDFENGQPWETTPAPSPPAGGHCVIENGCATLGVTAATGTKSIVGTFDLVTWGAETECTDNFWHLYGAEAWVLLPQWYVDSGQTAVQHLNLAQMQADINQIHATQ